MKLWMPDIMSKYCNNNQHMDYCDLYRMHIFLTKLGKMHIIFVEYAAVDNYGELPEFISWLWYQYRSEPDSYDITILGNPARPRDI